MRIPIANQILKTLRVMILMAIASIADNMLAADAESNQCHWEVI